MPSDAPIGGEKDLAGNWILGDLRCSLLSISGNTCEITKIRKIYISLSGYKTVGVYILPYTV